MPSLVMGMAPMHKPGRQPGKNATIALRSVAYCGHPAHYLAGDLAYTNAKPEDFQLPARALGYLLVLDYKSDQLGLQNSYAGMVQVDGDWYCPMIPEVLITATKDGRTIDEETRLARLKERRNHAIRRKGVPGPDGHTRGFCPAADPSPRARCELKPKSVRKSTRGKLRVQVTDLLLNNQPKICTQQSVTIPPEAGAKFAQALPHGSEEWHAQYSSLRNAVEGMNGYLKDGAHEALDIPRRRRIHGVAAQSVLVAFLILAGNLRKIDFYLALLAAERQGTVRRLPPRRSTTNLDHWNPPRTSAPPREPTPGPEPPIAG